MIKKIIYQKNQKFYTGIGLTILEGLLSGMTYITFYFVLQWIHNGTWSIPNSIKLSAGLIVLFLLRFFVYGCGYMNGQLGGASVSKKIRTMMGDKLRQIPLSRFTQGHVGEYVNTMNADVANYEKILTHNIGSIAKNVTLCIMLMGCVYQMYPPAGIIMFLTAFLLLPNLWLSFTVVKVYGRKKNVINAENISSIVEYITGIQTLRIYGSCGGKNKSTREAMRDYSQVCYHYEKYGIPISFIFNMLSWLSVPLIIFLSLEPYTKGQMDTMEFIMICMLPMLFVKLTSAISIDLFSYKNLLISKENITKIFQEDNEVGQDIPFSTDNHEIIFDNVNFAYEKGETVLDQVSFSIPDQKLTAIVGDSGSGKSTILNLISKYYDIQSGSISIGGIDINDIKAEDVLDKISIVDQDIILFNDTIRDNIRYARTNATDEEIINACKEANCDSFIQTYELGYDTMVGENGNRLSGGERQRLSIARAILKDSPILLLDEATASLDIENEYAVRKAIANLLKEQKTVVMVAHTLGLVRQANQILVLCGGKIVESGTHEELIKKNGKYKTMWDAEQKIQ